MAQPTQEGLVRGIRRWDLVAVAINGIIGAGIFGLPARTYTLIGTYSLLAFIACALIITGVVVALTALNITGVRQAAIASDLFTIGKLIPMLIFIAIGLFFLNPDAFTLGAAPSTGAFSQSVLLLIYAFTGFEMAAIPAGETRDPRRHLPPALLIAIGVVAIVYLMIQIVSIGTLPGLANSTKPLADAGQHFLARPAAY